MPVIVLKPFLAIVSRYDGFHGQMSLFTYHAVMFSAVAFVDMDFLHSEGYTTRLNARHNFFNRANLIYNHNCESNSIVLIQGLLLMSYWSGSSDGEKNTWHWIGCVISIVQDILLHRKANSMDIPDRRRRLLRRLWWASFMRDCLVAIGIDRPFRLVGLENAVPMLQESDFEIESMDSSEMLAGCLVLRDVNMQRELARLCIAKTELCVTMGRTITALNAFTGASPDVAGGAFDALDKELSDWLHGLPACCQSRPLAWTVEPGRSTTDVQRTLLHMIYHVTVWHMYALKPVDETRQRAHDGLLRITRMLFRLHQLKLDRYLPTTGVTVLAPCINMLVADMLNPDLGQLERDRATRTLQQCMLVLENLGEMYLTAIHAMKRWKATLGAHGIDMDQSASPRALRPTVHATIPDSATDDTKHMSWRRIVYATAWNWLERGPCSAGFGAAGALPSPSDGSDGAMMLRARSGPPSLTPGQDDVDLGLQSPPDNDAVDLNEFLYISDNGQNAARNQ